jgi:hypothetical protein
MAYASSADPRWGATARFSRSVRQGPPLPSTDGPRAAGSDIAASLGLEINGTDFAGGLVRAAGRGCDRWSPSGSRWCRRGSSRTVCGRVEPRPLRDRRLLRLARSGLDLGRSGGDLPAGRVVCGVTGKACTDGPKAPCRFRIRRISMLDRRSGTQNARLCRVAGPVQPRDQRPAVHQYAHGPVPPGQGLHQARHQLPKRTRPRPAPTRTPPRRTSPAGQPASQRRPARPRLATGTVRWQIRARPRRHDHGVHENSFH